MASHRKERVRELLKRAIGEAIRREIPVGSAGLVSVNDVELARDLRVARVFISVLGNATQQKTALTALHQQRARLQDLVAKSVILKYTPQLRFVMDDSIERGDRVLKLIEELERTTPGP
jgi:ribosome-binding factor A